MKFWQKRLLTTVGIFAIFLVPFLVIPWIAKYCGNPMGWLFTYWDWVRDYKK